MTFGHFGRQNRLINYDLAFGHQKTILFGSPGRSQNGALRRRPKWTNTGSIVNKHNAFVTLYGVLVILPPRPPGRFCSRIRSQKEGPKKL